MRAGSETRVLTLSPDAWKQPDYVYIVRAYIPAHVTILAAALLTLLIQLYKHKG